jgi:hypothetical protein
MNDDLEQLRALAGPLRLSLEADGAELVFDSYADGVLNAHLVFAEVGEPESDVLPAATLTTMLEALLKPRFNGFVRVRLTDPRN